METSDSLFAEALAKKRDKEVDRIHATLRKLWLILKGRKAPTKSDIETFAKQVRGLGRLAGKLSSEAESLETPIASVLGRIEVLLLALTPKEWEAELTKSWATNIRPHIDMVRAARSGSSVFRINGSDIAEAQAYDLTQQTLAAFSELGWGIERVWEERLTRQFVDTIENHPRESSSSLTRKDRILIARRMGQKRRKEIRDWLNENYSIAEEIRAKKERRRARRATRQPVSTK